MGSIKSEKPKEYFFIAKIQTDWKEENPITFKFEFNDTIYQEKGILLNVEPNTQIQYYHWGHFNELADMQES